MKNAMVIKITSNPVRLFTFFVELLNSCSEAHGCQHYFEVHYVVEIKGGVVNIIFLKTVNYILPSIWIITIIFL